MATVEMELRTRDLLAPLLPTLMQSVRRDGLHYLTMPAGKGAEAKYAERKHVDPDGRERDLLAEREQYLSDAETEVRTLRSWCLSKFLARGPARVLDVGCGYGRLLSALDGHGDRYGIEPSEHEAEYAKEHGTIHVGTLETIPETWRDFDVAILYHVIEHMTDPVDALFRVHDLLRPGGRLLVGTPDFDSPMARAYADRFRLLHDPTHISLFSTESLLRCLRDVGFEVERIDYPLPKRLDTEEAREAARRAGVSPPARGNIVTMYARRT